MAISRLNGKQIRPGVLTNQHVANDAGIQESKLDVNWAGHYQSALETKKVIDFVQVGNKMVSGEAEYNLTTNGVLLGGNVTTSTGTDEGVITDAPYNKVIIRDAVTGDAVLDAEGEEVFGRLVHDGVDFKILFMSPGLDGESNPAETPFTMPVDQEIDFQYMERFNLKTVSELFAANEKFVAGAADITAFQNIEQLAKDLYGAGYSLDRDGQGNLTVSIQKQINDEVQARQDADQAILDDLSAQAAAGKGANLVGVEDAGNRFLGGTVEAVLAEIKDALTDLEADLASIETGKGASKIGIEDASGKFTATNVEGALKELADRSTNLEQGSNAEVDNAKDRDAASANGHFEAKEFATLEERFVEIETVVDAEAKDKEDRVVALETEASDARQSTVKSADGGVTPKTFVSVDARLEEIEADHAQEVQDRTEADQAIRDDLASVEASKGASLIGIQDADNKIAAANVESALVELADRSTAVEERATDLEAEVEAARGSEASLDARLDRALNENGTLKAGQLIHEHFRARFQAAGGEAEVLLSQFTSKKTLPATFQVGDDSLEVYINGQLQEEGLNYQEAPTGDKITFDLGDGTVLEPTDIVQIKFQINNAE